jgi:RNA polymerase primary sigma factor
VQEGVLGLMRAIDGFDTTRDTKLSTYATYWIWQHIDRATKDQGSTVRLPVHIHDRMYALRRARQAWWACSREIPSEDDLVRTTGTGTRDAHKILAADAVSRPLSLHVARSALLQPMALVEGDDDMHSVSEYADAMDHAYIRQCVFCERPRGSQEQDDAFSLDDPTLESLLVSESDDPADEVMRTIEREIVEEALNVLTHREQRVIRMRFGLNGERPHTLEEVGIQFGLTRERIRQIQAKALARLAIRLRKALPYVEAEMAEE